LIQHGQETIGEIVGLCLAKRICWMIGSHGHTSI
jgi:hypothetical protein